MFFSETESWLGWHPSAEGNLKNCEGDCDNDASCAEGLKCYHNGIPPGCTGTIYNAYADYCYGMISSNLFVAIVWFHLHGDVGSQ